ncbi:hypothetical protein PTTG_29270 [Puccinia triticina 1-1 BBBD Race 1]|uniref:MBOAT_2 domain-containing protein n=2 Tax=Puccinia triticina TaxID=208348 RepID=A0A180G5C1_PUCT1|nr:uncharacterized protein PtA15_7A152 [Puccinia triticina]OAV87818.1 hypothetical protein PTTG_29270 [Puccinia triticina 1-1 BBBD Race 1]WAQ86426.1 hypothetical protein PtA15_7A152 [Puccinia triticina]WAR56307.1 hypothetical protein PtB15_7B153 [Puccinia triticina]
MTQEYSALFNQPMIQQKWAINAKPALFPVLTSIFLLFISAVSLPSKSRSAIYFRLALLPFQLMLAYDLCVNKNYSLGSAFRDPAFPSFGFLILYRAMDFSILNLWDPEPAFYWIVPDRPPTSDAKLVSSDEKSIRWRKVPHPPLFSFDRMLWALDNLTLMRPGTPFLFPWKIRALEWSQRTLESPETKFGEPEWPLLPAIIQQLVHLGCHLYIRQIDIKAGQQLWSLPLFVQCALSFALGGAVTFSYALEEAILFPLILRFKLLPKTALVSHSKRSITSAGLGELWGKRWHHIWKRCFVRLARLMPGSNNRLIQMFGIFWISGMFHCLLLARLYPTPDISRPMSFLPLVYEPGIYKFFLCQGIGVIVEKIVLGDPKKDEALTKKIIRLVYLYFVLLGAGRFSTNALAVKGLLDKDQWNTVTIPAISKMFYDIFTK